MLGQQKESHLFFLKVILELSQKVNQVSRYLPEKLGEVDRIQKDSLLHLCMIGEDAEMSVGCTTNGLKCRAEELKFYSTGSGELLKILNKGISYEGIL